MRRTIATLAVLPLALSAVATNHGVDEAALPDPIEVSMYFHGDGERYVDDDRADPLAATYNVMDRTAPATSDFESRSLPNYAAGPNPNCSGNYLLPVWTGYVGSGSIVGDATVTLDVIGTGGDVVVQLYSGISGQACNESYVQPIAKATASLPTGPGTIEVTLPLDGYRPTFDLMVQIVAAPSGPLSFNPTTQARVLYDGVDYAGSLSFTCQPDALADGETAEDADCMPF